MKVSALARDPFSDVPVLLLVGVDGREELPIWVGAGEAGAIATQLERIHLDRPATHDLMTNLLGVLGSRVERVEIHDLIDDTFYATLFVRPATPTLPRTAAGSSPGDVALAVDARPSDAIALALRAGAPIFVARHVLDNAHGAVSHTRPPAEPSPSPSPSVSPRLRVVPGPGHTKWRM